MTNIRIIQGFESIKPPKHWCDILVGTVFLGKYASCERHRHQFVPSSLDKEISLRAKVSDSSYINLSYGYGNFHTLSPSVQATALFHDYEEVDLEIKIIRKS